MPINPAVVPDDLRYLVPLAEKYGRTSRVSHFDKKLGRHAHPVERYSASDLTQLAGLYREIVRLDHNRRIDAWCRSVSTEDRAATEAVWGIMGLVLMFQRLASMKVAPFNSGQVFDVSAVERKPEDWSTFPRGLEVVRDYAKALPGVMGTDKFDAFMDAEGERNMAKLRQVAAIVNRHSDEISKWLDENPITESEAARKVYLGLMHLLDQHGLLR